MIAVARLTGRAVVAERGGGAVTRLSLDDGSDVVAKRGEPSAIAAEAAGLRWLAAADAVAVPAVRGVEEGLLVTDAVPEGRATTRAARSAAEPPRRRPDTAARSAAEPPRRRPDTAARSAAEPPRRRPGTAARRFGRELAGLHAAGAGAFGAPPPGGPVEAWIGGARMRNETGHSWPEWYAEHRVLPYAREAFSGGDLALVERACTRFAAWAGPPEPPARLHGDLWNGNVLWTDETAWVIDPAAHGGHRETDLAMLALFGCPHLEEILAAYDAAAPLADGWRDRVPMHQLHPLLVHAVLFGGGYARRVLRACAVLTGG